MRCNGLGVFLFTDGAQRFRTHLEIRNELGIELSKANEFCDVTDEFRSRPRLKETMLGLRWTITIIAYVHTNESETFHEERAFA